MTKIDVAKPNFFNVNIFVKVKFIILEEFLIGISIKLKDNIVNSNVMTVEKK